jgi:hypothetical protein
MRTVLATALMLVSSVAWAQQRTCPAGAIYNQNARACVSVNCPAGQAYNPNTNACFTPSANQDLTGYYVGGAIVLGGAIAAIIVANNGSKRVSP